MIQIQNRIMKLPIIQGGMGVGISLGNLAGAVAKEGGIGIISAAQPGFREEDFIKDQLPEDILSISIAEGMDENRTVTIEASGPKSQSVMEALDD